MFNQLTAVGLTSYQAKVYLALLEYGRLSARQIAEKSGVPFTAVYPNLNYLLEMNLIQKFNGSTAYFEAWSPTMALPALIKQKKQKLEEMEKTLVDASQQLFHRKQIVPKPEVLALSLGREASSAIYQDTLQRATKSFFILGWHFLKIKDKYVFLREFQKVLRRGVDVRIILTGPPEKNWDLVQAYLQAGIKM